MRHRDQAAAAVRRPVGDPAVVRAAHRLRVIGIVGIGFPGEVEAGIDDRGVEALLVEPRDTVLGVAGSQRDLVAVFDARIEISGVARDLAHLRDGAEVSAAIHARRHAIHFEVFESVLIFFQTDGVGSIFGLAVLLPAFGRFQDVAVGVNCSRIFQLMDIFFGRAPFAVPRFKLN